MEQESLNDIIGSSAFVSDKGPDVKPDAKPVEKAAPSAAPEVKEPVKEPEQKEPAKSDRDDKGRFTKPEDKTEAKPDVKAEEKPKDRLEKAQYTAILDERRKRQELEAKLKELQGAKPKTDFYEDADKAIQERLTEATTPLQERYFKLSLKVAQKLYPDYEEVATAFADATEHDPRLVQQLRESDDPGEFIYSIGKQIKELSDVGGDITKYREKVTAESTAKYTELETRFKALEAELAAVKSSQADLENVPRSLNKTTSGSSPKPGDEDPDDLKQIVRFNKS